jgi:anti-sigma factor ChrR (cupin superfamily)
VLSCREVTRRASDFIDHELSLREHLAVQLHLLMCVRCRRLVRHVRKLVAALTMRAEAASRPLDAAYIEKIVARLPAASGSDKDSDTTS